MSARRIRRAWVIALSIAAVAAFQHALAADDHGHGHDDEPAMVGADAPTRLPDGAVFLPKPAQRQLGVRTMVSRQAELARSMELQGRIVMDPNAGGRVQPLNAGRIEPGPTGLPQAGQSVRRGDTLAWVVSSSDPLERANQAAQLAELRAAKSLADRRLIRLRELSDTVPRKEIEAAESESRSLAGRISAVDRGLSVREALVAPVSGVVSSAPVVAGQVVDARELIFEIVDPTRLRVEALAFDPGIASNVGSASMLAGTHRVPLSYIGAMRTLREQAMPLAFQAEGNELEELAVGQAVRVVVQLRDRIDGIAVPAAALMKSPANQTIVWVKTAPERFEPRAVLAEPLDGLNVAITSGLVAGDRVVTQGATLVNQVR